MIDCQWRKINQTKAEKQREIIPLNKLKLEMS